MSIPWDLALKARDPELYRKLSGGKLWQVCPQCKRNEAAGPHCSRCGYATSEVDWFPNGELSEQLVARGAETAATRAVETRARALVRGKGRPRKDSPPPEQRRQTKGTPK